MALVKTDSKHYANIAAAVRQMMGESETYMPKQLAEKVGQVFEKGVESGHLIGYAEGHVSGFSDGEATERARFWEAYQERGERTNYTLGFAGVGWNEETFWPHYDINVQNGYQMFAYCSFAGSLKKRLEECRVSMYFSGDKSIMNLFGFASQITELGVIDLSGITLNNNTHIFNQCKALQTIERLILPPRQTTWLSWFSGCEALENVIFEGTIAYSGLNLSDSPALSHDSLMSILNCLADKSGSGSSWTVTLGATNLAKLTVEDEVIATQKGWTLA